MATIGALLVQLPLLSILVWLLFLVYWVQAFFIIYHLVRFGIGPSPKFFSLIFFIGSMALFAAAAVLYSQIDPLALASALKTKLPASPTY